MPAVIGDLRFGLRLLRKSPALTAAAVATLALGIGATSAVFSIINTVMLRPLPYPDPQRLVAMWGTDRRLVSSHLQPVAKQLPRDKRLLISWAPERWRALSQSFEHIGWYRGWMFNLTGAGEPERVESGLVSADFFATLGVQPALGRGFLPSEMTPGDDHVVLLGAGLWRRRFAADPHIAGKTVTIDGVTHTVIGVLPGKFQAMVPYIAPDVDIWAPISREYQAGRRWSIVCAVGRLKPGVSIPQAQSEMDAIAKRLESEHRVFQGCGVNLVRLDGEMISQVRQALLILLGAVTCVLLIACANLAGLMLARTAARQREIGIRTVLGAGRGRVVRQLLTESVLLAAIGGALGLLLSTWIARTIVLLHPGGIPRLDQVHPDATVFLFGLTISAAAGILFGLLPAFQFSRADVNEVLKSSGTHGAPGNRLLSPRSLLVTGEIGIALVLLIGAGLLLRSFALLKAVDPGFNTESLLTMTVPLPQAVYRAPAQQRAFAEQLLERVRTIPSVQVAAVSNTLPMASNFSMSMQIEIEGRQLPESDSSVSVRAVSLDYFRTMGIALMKGRDFTAADQGKSDVLIVNQAMARHYWPGADPVGRQIRLEGKAHTIAGMVANVKNFGLQAETGIEVYVPFADAPTTYVGLAVRTLGDPGAVAGAVRAVVHGVDRNLTVDRVASMREILNRLVAGPRFDLALLGSFAALALVLAVVGIYGVVSYSVAQRTREIGVRMALGAERPAVLRMVMAQGAMLACAGIALGLAGSFAATRVLQSFLFGIPPRDGVTFAAVSLLLLAICLLASYIPARRAAKVDPMVALRYE
jgi:putative ABC transport system permease protein